MEKPERKESDEALRWELLEETHPVQDQWMDLRASTYRMPDGSVFTPFYSYSRRSYVVIVAIDTGGNYICVRQFRPGIKCVTTEFPAGGIERSDGREYALSATDASLAENALETAQRELLEETGYESDDWTHLLTVPSNATISDNYAYLFLAKDCRPVGEQHLDETEFLRVELHTESEIREMIRANAFPQATHILAFLLSQNPGGI
ncbi:MAG: NUDIX hydrolase [Lachnospiraceae bacterium]|nr:NUDIX hydrolase [Lachnospiraceae bacterium]